MLIFDVCYMAQQEKNIINQQLVHSYLSSVISISLVLLVMGLAALLAINAQAVSRYFKEKMGFSLELAATVQEADSTRIIQEIIDQPFAAQAIRRAVWISRERGKQEMAEMLGQDFMDVFETNPLPVSVELQLKAPYVQQDSLAKLERVLRDFTFVQEVTYQASIIDAVNRNIERIGWMLAVLMLVLLFISFALIHNTIKLSVYARRFTIHTMRLVGATRLFIRRPFMIGASLQGLIASLVANLLLLCVLFWLQKQYSTMLMLIEPYVFAVIMVGILIIGVFLCRVSTRFVVNKVVRMEVSSLYY